MSNVDVNLDVRNWASNGTDGYTNTTASNDAVYCYRYTGGTDGAGGVEESISAGGGTITVTVGTAAQYHITGVTFTGDIESQLSWVQGSGPNSAVITDTDTSSGDGEYSIIVTDTAANCTFPCDPPIKNKPNK